MEFVQYPQHVMLCNGGNSETWANWKYSVFKITSGKQIHDDAIILLLLFDTSNYWRWDDTMDLQTLVVWVFLFFYCFTLLFLTSYFVHENEYDLCT
jgi:hypothetical protein